MWMHAYPSGIGAGRHVALVDLVAEAVCGFPGGAMGGCHGDESIYNRSGMG